MNATSCTALVGHLNASNKNEQLLRLCRYTAEVHGGTTRPRIEELRGARKKNTACAACCAPGARESEAFVWEPRWACYAYYEIGTSYYDAALLSKVVIALGDRTGMTATPKQTANFPLQRSGP